MEIKPEWWRMGFEYFIWTSIFPLSHFLFVGPQWPYLVNIISFIGPECIQSVKQKLIIGPQCLYSVIIIPIIGPQCPYSVNLKSSSMSRRTLRGFFLGKKLRFLELRNTFSKSVYFLILNNFSKNGSPGQTTMLMRRAAKFCVEPGLHSPRSLTTTPKP